MKQIRKNVFETNSSSTHSMVIVEENDYDRWLDGTLWYDANEEKFVEKEEMEKRVAECEKEFKENYPNEEFDVGEFRHELPMTFEDYRDYHYNLETDTTHYTTKNGDKIVIIDSYGYDG